MAEAHSAVAFQFAVTDEGVLFHIDRTAIKVTLEVLLRILLRRFYKIRTSFLKGIFPATPISLVIVTGIFFALYAAGFDPSFGLFNILSRVPRSLGISVTLWNLGLVFVESCLLWTLLCYLQRYALKALLMYKGWMFDERGKRSWKTKAFGILVKLVAGTANPLLGSYQHSIPHLPLPSLNDTCNRYLKSVRALYSDEEYEEKKRLVEEFKKGPGNKLQMFLILKSWMSTNYVTDWWEKYVYHGWRGSIMINSNYYACDQIGKVLTNKQLSRTAFYIYAAMLMKKEIENETLKPLIIMDLIPLCSFQYKRLFATCRIPGQSEDKLLCASPAESKHIVCYRLGRWYKIPLYYRKKLLKPVDIEWQLQKICDDDLETVSDGERYLAALTSAERPFWAEVREKYFSTGVNKQYMDTIEKAACVIVLDDKESQISMDGEDRKERLINYCVELIHGQGYKFWFDKTFTCITYTDGRIGINAEHSWGDAPIIGHMLEYCSNLEYTLDSYDENGHCSGEATANVLPQRMKWEISEPCQEKIMEALTNARVAIDDIDLYVNQHDAFGKGVIKKCGFSPDAFIQMALQLAYYREAGKFCLTYEASMTRLYREGRTETVRPISVESSAFVRAMCDPESTKEECKRLLKVATDAHVLAYKNAMIGHGIDRHLFCLYVVSRGKEIPSPFLESVIHEPWKLSTSQTPTQQTGRIDFNNYPYRISPGGGFGPVTKDGYGVSYIIPGDYVFYFHVSSFKSSPYTDSRRFAKAIADSLHDMIKLFDITLKRADSLQSCL